MHDLENITIGDSCTLTVNAEEFYETLDTLIETEENLSMSKKGILKLVIGGVLKYVLGKILREVDTSIFTSWDVYYCSECKTFHAFVKPGVCPFCYGTTKIFAIPTFEANTPLFR